MSDTSGLFRVMTYKAGNFPFSSRFDKKSVENKIVAAKAVYETVADMAILPHMVSRLEEEVIRRSIFSTAAIEGNPLNEREVADVYDKNVAGPVIIRAEREIYNLKAAYALALSTERPETCGLEISEGLIREYNRLITQGIEHPGHIPGGYRNHLVEVGNDAHGGVYRPPKILKDVETLMAALVQWLNSEPIRSLGEIARAALAHYHLACIHPFGDGNGRTARLLEAAMISACGVRYVPKMLSNYYYRFMDDYYIVFRRSQKSKNYDITPFMAFFADAFSDSVTELRDKVYGFIRKLTLRTHFDNLLAGKDISERQHGLLALLLEADLRFSLKDLLIDPRFGGLYRSVSELTARRDLKKLGEMGLLKRENGEYRLNERALG